MKRMFRYAAAFNADISALDTGQVTDMYGMFEGAAAFNADISAWDTGQVTSMDFMFNEAYTFNADISAWDTGQVTSMEYMFNGADTFNADISAWDTGQVTSMKRMFQGAVTFNADISAWDTGQVTSMDFMFNGADTFNADISAWDTGQVTSMEYMFSNAAAFNHALCWDTTGVTTDGMFGGSVGTAGCVICAVGQSGGSAASIEDSLTCLDCVPGQYAESKGLTNCKGCPAGKFSSASASTGCTQCLPGKYAASASATCSTCPDRQYAKQAESAACDDCQALECALGEYNICGAPTAHASDGGLCLPCLPGRFLDDGAPTAACQDDNSGVAWLSDYSCTTLALYGFCDEANDYSLQTNNRCPAACDSCTDAATGLGQWSTCRACVPGQYSLASSTQCFMCEPGKYQVEEQQPFCAVCEGGRYSVMAASTACIACSVGTYSSVSATVCSSCEAGKVQGLGAQSSCNLCDGASNEYQDETGRTSCKTCAACPIGARQGCGGSSKGYCTDCIPGQYIGLGVCTKCPAGYYQAGISAPLCEACPAGTYQHTEGQTFCRHCPTNSESSVHARSLTECQCKAQYFLCTSAASIARCRQDQCSACPYDAVCSLGENLQTLQSSKRFWRATENSTVFHRCLQPEACIGGRIIRSRDNQCAAGYLGVRCELCDRDSGFAVHYSPMKVCSLCGKSKGVISAFITAGAFVAVVLLLWACIKWKLLRCCTATSSVLVIAGEHKGRTGRLRKRRALDFSAPTEYEIYLDEPQGQQAEGVGAIREGSVCIHGEHLQLRRVSFQEMYQARVSKIKIAVQFFQISSGLSETYRLPFPPIAVNLLQCLVLLDFFELPRIVLALDCWRHFDYVARLYFQTLSFVVIMFLAVPNKARTAASLLPWVATWDHQKGDTPAEEGRKLSMSAPPTSGPPGHLMTVVTPAMLFAAQKVQSAFRSGCLNPRRQQAWRNIQILRNNIQNFVQEARTFSRDDFLLLFSYAAYTSLCDICFMFYDCKLYEDAKIYLVPDPSITCTSDRWLDTQYYVHVMSASLPLGIPCFYIYTLLKHQHIINPALLSIQKDRDYVRAFATAGRVFCSPSGCKLDGSALLAAQKKATQEWMECNPDLCKVLAGRDYCTQFERKRKQVGFAKAQVSGLQVSKVIHSLTCCYHFLHLDPIYAYLPVPTRSGSSTVLVTQI
jgi:surface protein